MKRQIGAALMGMLAAMAAAPALWAKSPAHAIVAPKPLVITQGGAYSGNWESRDARVPAVLVQTSQPVIIQNATLRGRGNLIQTAVPHARLVIRHVRGVAINPNIRGVSPGRFLTSESFNRIDIENCDLRGTAGIYLLTYAGDFAAGHTITILHNTAENIDGRKSDGRGGFLQQATPVQFVQLDKVRHLPGIEIAWNQVINQPGKSGVEDVISIYQSSGTAASPIRIHDNFIDGAYPANPNSKDYSGGGIMLGDGSAAKPDDACAFVAAYANQVIDTTNYGIAISAGHDIVFYDNRILSPGLFANGRRIPAQNVGAYIWDTHGDSARTPPTFFNDAAHDNLIGWRKAGARNDWWTPNAAAWTHNLHWPGHLTARSTQSERAVWQQKLKAHQITPGP